MMALTTCAALRHPLLAPQLCSETTAWSSASPCRLQRRSPTSIPSLKWTKWTKLSSSRRIVRVQAQKVAEGSEKEKEKEKERGKEKEIEKEGLAAATVGIVAPEPSTAAIEVAVATAADTSAGEEELATGEQTSYIGAELKAIYATQREWTWRGYPIVYTVQGTGPPLLLVHGFGASIGHWRRHGIDRTPNERKAANELVHSVRKNIGVLAESNTVYAIDLLGLGGSAKPSDFQYTMETWADQLVDFIKEVVDEPTVLVGNSIGGLACLIATAEAAPLKLVRGLVLLNCAGGMNNKAVYDDWRIKLASPLFWLVDFLLKQPSIAGRLFNRVKSRDNLKTVLRSVYSNKEAVDDELVEVVATPADTEGALDAFVSIITGPPGPKPDTLTPAIKNPILVLWGDTDPFTPVNGPVGKHFQSLAETNTAVELHLLKSVGHCPQDDRPELVHAKLLPWLAQLPALA